MNQHKLIKKHQILMILDLKKIYEKIINCINKGFYRYYCLFLTLNSLCHKKWDKYTKDIRSSSIPLSKVSEVNYKPLKMGYFLKNDVYFKKLMIITSWLF